MITSALCFPNPNIFLTSFKGIRYGSIPQLKKFIRATLHILFISKSDLNMLYIPPVTKKTEGSEIFRIEKKASPLILT